MSLISSIANRAGQTINLQRAIASTPLLSTNATAALKSPANLIQSVGSNITDWFRGGIDRTAQSGLGSIVDMFRRSALGPSMEFGQAADGTRNSLLGQPTDLLRASALPETVQNAVDALATSLSGGDDAVRQQLTNMISNSLAGSGSDEQMMQSLRSLADGLGLSPKDLFSSLVSLQQSGKIDDSSFQRMLHAILQMIANTPDPSGNSAPADSPAVSAAGAGGKSGASSAAGTSGSGGSSNKGPSVKVDGPGGFLWKPVSDSDRKLVVLAPPNMSQNVGSAVIKGPDGKVIEEGRLTTRDGNGGRAHFRFSKQGSEYPNGSTVEFRMSDGSVKTYTIGDTSMRHD